MMNENATTSSNAALAHNAASATPARVTMVAPEASKPTRILSGVIFYGLLVCIALAAIPYGTVEAWWEALYGCLVFGLTALACVEIALSRAWPRSPWLWLMLPLVGVFALMWLQSLALGAPPPEAVRVTPPEWWAISTDPYETRRQAWRLLALMLTGALLFRYTNSPRRLRVLIGLVVCIALGSALFALARVAGQREVGFILPRLRMDERRSGQFINRNHFAFMLEMGLGLLLGLLAGRGLARERWPILVGPAFLLWAVLVLTNSRGGLLAFATQIVFVVLLYGAVRGPKTVAGAPRNPRRKWLERGALVVLLLLIVGLGALWVGGDALTTRLQETSSELEGEPITPRDQTSRADMWRAAGQMFLAHPLLGTGVGSFRSAIAGYHNASGRLTPRQAHNDYLEILASGGLVFFGLAVWFGVILVRQARRQLASPDPFRRAACFGACVGLFGVAVHSTVDFGLHLTINALLFVCLCVIATASEGVAGVVENRRRNQAAPEVSTIPARKLGAWIYAGAAVGVLLCGLSLWHVGWIGLSRLLSNFGRTSDGRNAAANEAAQRAADATPYDPEAQSAQGLALLAQRRYPEAIAAFEQAVAMRPRDYIMWLQLGRAYDIANQEAKALPPTREAQRLAPHYAQPTWQLANLLFRGGQTDEGLATMRRATASDADLFPNFVDLAWTVADEQPSKLLAAVQPSNEMEHKLVARYLIRKNKLPEAVAQLQQVQTFTPDERRQFTGDFINARDYRAAYAVWATGNDQKPNDIGRILNGDFESDFRAGEQHFNWLWQLNETGVTFARDANQPHSGQYSLRLEYNNQKEPARTILQQSVPVAANTRYRLSFAARTKDLQTAGNPLIKVIELGSHPTPFTLSAPLKNSATWQNYALDFTTGGATTGIVIYLLRENCTTNICPIYGTLWLDSFALQK